MLEPFSKSTDGFFARHFDRKISGAISRVLLKTPVTPNQITIFVTVLGVGAGWLMSRPGHAAKVEGALLFLLTSILDGCDGEIARAKKLTSELGGWLDLWGDNVVHVAVFYGMGIGLFRDTGQGLYLTLGKAAVIGTVISAALASYQTYRKNVPSPSTSPTFGGRGDAKNIPSPPQGERVQGEGASLFTSVVGDPRRFQSSPWRMRLVQVSDALARRDFVYGVVVLALVRRLSWFLWACAVGSVTYACILGILCLFTRPSASRP